MNKGEYWGISMSKVTKIATVMPIGVPFTDASEAHGENHAELFVAPDDSAADAGIAYMHAFEEKNAAQNFKHVEFDNGALLRESLNRGTLFNSLKANDVIRIDQLYDVCAGSTAHEIQNAQSVVDALQKAVDAGKLVILSGNDEKMKTFLDKYPGLKTEGAGIPSISKTTQATLKKKKENQVPLSYRRR